MTSTVFLFLALQNYFRTSKFGALFILLYRVPHFHVTTKQAYVFSLFLEVVLRSL